MNVLSDPTVLHWTCSCYPKVCRRRGSFRNLEAPPLHLAVLRPQSFISYRVFRHRYLDHAADHQISEVGVKIFKTNKDARRAAKQVLPFHNEQVHRLPGLPNDHVQKTLGWSIHRSTRGVERPYVIQEWVFGLTLEELLRREWLGAPPGVDCVKTILEQLFWLIIIPLWSEETIWWDIRDANYCWDSASKTLKFIDVLYSRSRPMRTKTEKT